MNHNAVDFLNTLSGKKIALCGIGKSNLYLIKLFKKYGASVIACDKRDEKMPLLPVKRGRSCRSGKIILSFTT